MREADDADASSMGELNGVASCDGLKIHFALGYPLVEVEFGAEYRWRGLGIVDDGR